MAVSIGNLIGTLELEDRFSSTLQKFGTGIDTITAFVKKALQAQSEQEEAINKLNLALSAQGKFTAAASKDLVDYAGSLQDTTRFSDDAVIAAESFFIQMGLGTEDVKKATQASADFAATTGQGIESAAHAVGMGVNGMGRAFRLYGIQLQKTGDQSSRLDNLTDQIAQKFGGMAVASTQTYAGQLALLENQLGESWEAAGKFLGEVMNFGEGGPFSAAISMVKRFNKFISTDVIIALSEARAQFAEFLAMLFDIQVKVSDFISKITGGKVVLPIGEASRAAAEDQRKLAAELRAQGDAAAASAGKTMTFANSLNKGSEGADRLSKEAKRLAEEMEKLKNELSGAAELAEIDKLTTAFASLMSEGKASEEAMKRAMAELENHGKAGAEAAQAIRSQWLQANGMIDANVRSISLAEESLKEVQATADEQANAYVKGLGAAETAQTTLNAAIIKAAAELHNTQQISDEVFDKIVKDLGIASTAAAKTGLTFKQALGETLKQLPQTIIAAIQGGGDVGKAVGASIGKSIGDSLAQKAGSKVANALGGKIGSAIGGIVGSVVPVLGTAIGAVVGGAIGKGIGKLFGGNKELKQLNDMRDAFFEAQGGFAALQARLSSVTSEDLVKRIFDARTVEEFNAALAETQMAFDMQGAAQQELQAAIEKYGFTIEELGPKFRQQEMDKIAIQLTKEFSLLVASGIDVNKVIERMGPALTEFLDTARRTGTAVPEAMRPMVEALIKSGGLVDENGVAFESAEEAGITFAKSIEESMSAAVDQIKRLVDALLGVGNIKIPQINIPIGTVGSGGQPIDIPGFAGGGIVTSPTLGIIGEHGPEVIIPLDQLGAQGGGIDMQMMRDMMSLQAKQLTRSFRDALLQAQ
jgi:hypothetical protein